MEPGIINADLFAQIQVYLISELTDQNEIVVWKYLLLQYTCIILDNILKIT